jgi:hypothetical protein
MAARVLVCADVRRRVHAQVGETMRGGVDLQIHPAELPAAIRHRGDADVVDDVRHRGVGVAGDDRLDRPWRQAPGQVEDLALLVARPQVAWIAGVAAPAAFVCHDDHDLRAAGAKRGGLPVNGREQRRRVQPFHVRRQRLSQAAHRHQADEADLDAGRVDDCGRRDVGPRDRRAGAVVDDVGGEEREVCAGGRRLERAARVGVGVGHSQCAFDRVGGIHRAEVEVVVADRPCGVAQRVVGVYHDPAFRQVRFDAALERVAGVEQQQGAAVRRARGPQVVDEAAEDPEASPSEAVGEDAAVQVVGADDRERDASPRCELLRRGGPDL